MKTGKIDGLYWTPKHEDPIIILTELEYREAVLAKTYPRGMFGRWEFTVTETKQMANRKYFAADKEPDNETITELMPERYRARWAEAAKAILQRLENRPAEEEERAKMLELFIETDPEMIERIAGIKRLAEASKRLRDGIARPLDGGNASDLTSQPDMFCDVIPTALPLFDFKTC